MLVTHCSSPRPGSSSVPSVGETDPNKRATSPIPNSAADRSASPMTTSTSSVDAAKRNELKNFFDGLIGTV